MTSLLRGLRAWATLSLIAALSAGGCVMAEMPSTISHKVRSASQAPALKSVTVNGYTLAEARFSSVSETGGVPFPAGDGTLRYRIAWREILGNGRYASEFSVPVERLSAFKSDRSFVGIEIVLGPGADVTVQTPNPDLLRLVEEGRSGEVTADQRRPVTLLELCADPLGAGDAMAAALGRPVTAGERGRATTARDRASGTAARSRCGSGG